MKKILVVFYTLLFNFVLMKCQPAPSYWTYGIGLTKDNIVVSFKDDYEEFIIPDEYNGEPITQIGYYDWIHIPYKTKRIFIGKNVSKIVFFNGPNLEELDVHEENEHFAAVDGVLYNKALSELLIYPLNKSDKKFVILDSVERIGDDLWNNKLLEEIWIYSEKLTELSYERIFSVYNSKSVKTFYVKGSIYESFKQFLEEEFSRIDKPYYEVIELKIIEEK